MGTRAYARGHAGTVTRGQGVAARIRGLEGTRTRGRDTRGLEAQRLRGKGGRPARPRMTGPVIPTLWPGKWSSEGESNPHHPVRSRAFCPLNYLTIWQWCGERDSNPQNAGSKPAMSAVASPPQKSLGDSNPGLKDQGLKCYHCTKGLLKFGRRGETTPFIAGLWPDYALQ